MTDTQRTREQALVLRCQLGEPEAFRELVALCDRPLRYYIRHLMRDEAEAADVAQEVWLTIIRKLSRLEHPEAFRSWMYRIAHSLVISRVRRQTSRLRAEEAWAVDQSEPVELSLHQIDAAALHKAIEQLNDVQREVVLLSLVGDLTVNEMAIALGVPAGTVKSRMHHARRHLRDLLGE